MNDPIADMLTQIRNAISANKADIRLPHSILKEKVAKILQTNGFLHSTSTDTVDSRKYLVISINAPGQPAVITEINRLSRPGRRTYIDSKRLPLVRRGRGIVIVSTSQGLMTGDKAKSKRLGGELICEIY